MNNMEHNEHKHSHNEHDHGHHHHDHTITTLSTAFVVGTLLNLAFVIVEGGAGLFANSMGLLSDAGHNLSDTVSLFVAWIAFKMTSVTANKRFTYGYSKSTILASLLNASLLLIAIGMIVVESIRKFSDPQPINSDTIIWVAAVGIVINFATALLFMKDRKKDLNVNGAFLHMAMDALVSLGVVVSGVVIKYTGWVVIDPIIGLVVAAVILVSTWNLLKESVRLSLDGVPESIDLDEIEKNILALNGVASIHHIHVWALGTSANAMTVHVALDDIRESENLKSKLRKLLEHNGIRHATIETEPKDYVCSSQCCSYGHKE